MAEKNLKDLMTEIKDSHVSTIDENLSILSERRLKIRVTSKGVRIKRIKCDGGRILKNVNGVKTCVAPTGRQKLIKRLAVRKMIRTKRSKGSGYAKRINIKRQRGIRRRKQMGLRPGQ